MNPSSFTDEAKGCSRCSLLDTWIVQPFRVPQTLRSPAVIYPNYLWGLNFCSYHTIRAYLTTCNHEITCLIVSRLDAWRCLEMPSFCLPRKVGEGVPQDAHLVGRIPIQRHVDHPTLVSPLFFAQTPYLLPLPPSCQGQLTPPVLQGSSLCLSSIRIWFRNLANLSIALIGLVLSPALHPPLPR